MNTRHMNIQVSIITRINPYSATSPLSPTQTPNTHFYTAFPLHALRVTPFGMFHARYFLACTRVNL